MTSIDKIKAVELHIANAANITVRELRSRVRTQNLADARAAVWWVLRKRLGLSYQYIGKYYSRDHTTVLRAVQRADTSNIAVVAQTVIEAKDPSLLRKQKNAGTLSVDNWVY
jgi:chromosomal replication initiation ATPase DnaA